MAQRGVAWTYLDVKYPQQMCRGCDNEFEYLAKDCTHPHVSFAPPLTEQSSKGKGGGKGKSKSKSDYGYGYNDTSSKGSGKGKGKSKGKNVGKDVGNMDIIGFLKQFGANIITEEQADQLNDALQTHAQKLKPQAKSDLQTANHEYKAAMSEMNGARNLLNQAKNSVAALDIKFKAAMISVCEQTSRYNFLKAQAEKCKDKYDTLHQAQELITDASLLEITSAHANAMTQFAFTVEEE